MAVNKRVKRTIGRRLRPYQRHRGKASREHQAGDQQPTHRAENSGGIIRVETGMLNLPGNLDYLGGKKPTTRPDKVVTVIVLLSIAFITLIALFVSQMPVKN